MADVARLFQILDDLIEGWCERRALGPLGVLLPAYPPAPVLTDGWATLYATVRNLNGLAADVLQPAEQAAVSEAHTLVYGLLSASPTGVGIIRAAIDDRP